MTADPIEQEYLAAKVAYEASVDAAWAAKRGNGASYHKADTAREEAAARLTAARAALRNKRAYDALEHDEIYQAALAQAIDDFENGVPPRGILDRDGINKLLGLEGES